MYIVDDYSDGSITIYQELIMKKNEQIEQEEVIMGQLQYTRKSI